MTNLINDLKQSYLKVTPQRLAIYGYLMGTTEHPSAEMIYSDLREDYPNMSLATVYKTVAVLKEAGLVQELNVGEDSFRYDANVKPHAHIVCKKCHRVADYHGKTVSDETVRLVEKATGYDIDGEQIYFFGTCSECK